jgi:hypothetical protein
LPGINDLLCIYKFPFASGFAAQDLARLATVFAESPGRESVDFPRQMCSFAMPGLGMSIARLKFWRREFTSASLLRRSIRGGVFIFI